MLIIIQKIANGNRWDYPGTPTLFPGAFANPSDTDQLIVTNNSGMTLAALSANVPYTVTEYLGLSPVDDAKTARIALIKTEANDRIVALDWKVTRVSERKQRSRASQAEYDAVLDERETIRTASDQAEIDVSALTTVQDVQNFTW